MTAHRCLVVLATVLVPAALPAAEKTLGEKIAAHLESMKGKRLGGGECAQMVTETLRINGGTFIRKDTSSDYVWSKTLVVKVTGGKDGPALSPLNAKMSPGDIIQYTNARFKEGRLFVQHTSVVAAVDAKGLVTEVYEQNVARLTDGKVTMLRHVVREKFDLSQLSAGHLKVYRPDARPDKQGRFEFSLVNNTDSPRTCKLKLGTRTLTINLTRAGTARSYNTWSFFTKSRLKPTLLFGTTTLTAEDGQGYEVVLIKDKAVLRKLDR